MIDVPSNGERCPIETAFSTAPAPLLASSAQFISGSLKITGPKVDPAALKAYVEVTLERTERAGVEVMVFGSGGARQVPDGFDRTKAYQ